MNKFVTSAAIGLAAIAASATSHEMSLAADSNKEKCYGVAKAGENDCGSKANSHSCAGLSTIDGDKNEFITVPKGLCERLAGSSPTEGGSES